MFKLHWLNSVQKSDFCTFRNQSSVVETHRFVVFYALFDCFLSVLLQFPVAMTTYNDIMCLYKLKNKLKYCKEIELEKQLSSTNYH